MNWRVGELKEGHHLGNIYQPESIVGAYGGEHLEFLQVEACGGVSALLPDVLCVFEIKW